MAPDNFLEKLSQLNSCDSKPGSWIQTRQANETTENITVRRSKHFWYHVRFEVSTAVTMKNAVFWDVTPCGSFKNRRFGGTYRLLHQGDKSHTV
jgi:hypothetical protein